MAVYLSYDHAKIMISLLYKEQGFELIYPPGDTIAKEIKFDVTQAPLGATFAFLDEQIFVLRYLSHYFITCIIDEKDAIAYKRLCDALLSTLTSIRILSSLGFDGSARTQLRYLYEVSILWCRAILDPEMRGQLKEDMSFNKSNKFWHIYLSKRKTEKFIIKSIKNTNTEWLGNCRGKDDTLVLDSIYERLGLSAHPSIIGIAMHASDDFSAADNNLIIRSVNLASRFTLNSALFLTALPFGFIPIHKYRFRCRNLFDPKAIYPPHPEAENWQGYCTKLEKIIPAVFMAHIRFDEHFAKGKFPIFEGSSE